jgi:hypothetical protein
VTALRDSFERDGVVRVAGAIDPDAVRAMRDRARGALAAIDLVDVAGARRPARGTELALYELGRDPAFAPLPGAFARALDDVFGAGAWTPVAGEEGGLLMPNLPGTDTAWSASEVSWHVDEPCAPGAAARVLIGYALLDLVEPGGGATVALAGSHRRLAAIADARGAALTYDDARAAVPELADLARVELTGAAGDLVLFDPRCLHTISANVSPRPRLVMRLTGSRG